MIGSISTCVTFAINCRSDTSWTWPADSWRVTVFQGILEAKRNVTQKHTPRGRVSRTGSGTHWHHDWHTLAHTVTINVYRMVIANVAGFTAAESEASVSERVLPKSGGLGVRGCCHAPSANAPRHQTWTSIVDDTSKWLWHQTWKHQGDDAMPPVLRVSSTRAEAAPC